MKFSISELHCIAVVKNTVMITNVIRYEIALRMYVMNCVRKYNCLDGLRKSVIYSLKT